MRQALRRLGQVVRHSGRKWPNLSPLHPVAGCPLARARAWPGEEAPAAEATLGSTPRPAQGCLWSTLPAAGQLALPHRRICSEVGEGARACASPPPTTDKNEKFQTNMEQFEDGQTMARRPNLAQYLFWKLFYWDTASLIPFVLRLLPVAALALKQP